MIIECKCKKKKFEIDSSLIPEKGRTIQCGSCNEIWFYVPKQAVNYSAEVVQEKTQISNYDKKLVEEPLFNTTEDLPVKTKKILKSNKLEKNNHIKISKILSYIIVIIFSFIAIIVVLETFKSPLRIIFPNLELFLYNFFETLKDMFLFFKNLII